MLDTNLSISCYEVEEQLLVLRPELHNAAFRWENTADEDEVSELVGDVHRHHHDLD
jgi:hypothetical protein